MTGRVFQLSGTCNDYSWGKKGRQSLAAQLCARTPGTDFKIEDDKHYSEMWFGDYPDYPARVLETGELLKDRINKDQEKLLGKKVIEKMDAQLPFLPKILSIATALPLQIHPNKELATKLHEKDPENFTDTNHKPEIAVALSKFEPLFKKVLDLSPFVPEDAKDTQWTDQTLREVTRNMLKAQGKTVKNVLHILLNTDESDLGDAAYIVDLIPRLVDQYGSTDPGSLVALLCMNFMVLGPGDAIYIPADGIHAYLSGNIVECMARSNDVLNAGFCPPADRNNIDMFAETLTFKAHSVDDVKLPSKRSDKSKTGKTIVYSPPMSEFDILKTGLHGGESDEISASDGPGVFIVTQGHGKMEADGKTFDLSEGYIFYVAPGVPVRWETETGMQIHMAVV
ncbi:RmlC-like cupin domain-containing protein [Diplogelasinospora grovesii]|uniref:Mannose-6-phosphate isomerase n=1 Tax=Diplogelasinospora grovesii TaxID=303347 RepID=A0AAN6S5Q7_9PEZI|nr:RmlC-like cupin domain-containing protein [Diplogelasinospora grovesii]